MTISPNIIVALQQRDMTVLEIANHAGLSIGVVRDQLNHLASDGRARVTGSQRGRRGRPSPIWSLSKDVSA